MPVYTVHMCKENTWYLLGPTETSSVQDVKLGMVYL